MFCEPFDFQAFILLYLRDYLVKQTEETILSDFHRELCSLCNKPRLAIAAPRSFAKSSYYAFFYPLYMALHNPNIKILIVSSTSALTEDWVRRIRNELEVNDKIKATFGDLKGAKWRDDHIELSNGVVIMGKGAEKAIRGLRPDIAICDDMESEEMVASPERLKKFEHWFRTDLTGTLKPESQLIIVGTILDPDSFLSGIMNYPPYGWTTRLYKALKNNGDALWPEQWTRDKLLQRKEEIGDSAFSQEYMNDPIRAEDRTFKREQFRYIDDLKNDKENEFGLPLRNYTYFTMVDPAIEVGVQNDFTAIVTIAVDSDENIYIIDTVRKKLAPKQLIDKIFEIYIIYSPASIGIEEQGFQKMLKNEIERQRSERKEYPVVVGLKSGGKKKTLRIESLQPRFQSGKVFHRRSMEELETELLRFPSPRCHDDLIDALAYSLDIIRPAKNDAIKVNPNSFDALMEKRKRRRKRVIKGVWGNHHMR